MSKRLLLLLVLSIASIVATVPKVLLPDDLTGAGKFGCIVDLVSGTPRSWQTHVWIEFPKPPLADVLQGKPSEWIRLYSVRLASERHKALKDCDRWMGEAVKILTRPN
jgi:hypothetical protein